MASTPKTRVEFWTSKFARNVERDKRNQDALQELGWDVLTVWECETRRDDLREKLAAFMAAEPLQPIPEARPGVAARVLPGTPKH